MKIYLYLDHNIYTYHVQYFTKTLTFPATCHIILTLVMIRKRTMFSTCCYISILMYSVEHSTFTSYSKFGSTSFLYNLFPFFLLQIILCYIFIYHPGSKCEALRLGVHLILLYFIRILVVGTEIIFLFWC